MSKIVLKTTNRKTSIPKNKIRAAVAAAYATIAPAAKSSYFKKVASKSKRSHQYASCL